MDKLTKVQRALLLDIASAPRAVNTSYAPAKKLVGYGLAEWVPQRFSDQLRPTPAGVVRARLERGRG